MTSVYIACGIIVVLVVLVCYAFMIQTVTRKREQQQRLSHALEKRIKNFRTLQSGFPDGFLPRELNLLIYRQLVDAAQQLTALGPKNKQYVEELEFFSKEMSEVQRKPPSNRQVRMQSVRQGKEIKHYLSELNKFVHRTYKRGKLTDAEFNGHTGEIRQLVLNITVDGYIDQAQASETSEKPRMALHYYTIARNLLAKESLSPKYKQQINELDRHIIRLEANLEPEPALANSGEEDNSDSGWDEFSTDDSWKKKAIYD